MKISVGLPVYDRKVDMNQVACLLAETSLANLRGDVLNVRFLASCTNLAFGRNHIVREFMESGDDRLVFLDGDVTFEQGDLLKLAHHPVDVVGGAYRLKQDLERYPVNLLQEARPFGPGGLVEVGMLPTGFLALSRCVFERFRDHYPGREYNAHGRNTYAYFQIPFHNGSLFTEDSYFCKEWIAKGEKLYLDPTLTLTHWQGNIPYTGNIGTYYQKRMSSKQQQQEASA